MNKRYVPKRPLPPYAFIPGKNPHPEKEGGHMFGHVLSCKALHESNYQENEDYLYAFDLFNHGHYWESHVWWEELWNLAGRKGDLPDLLKALIKLAAAGVKFKLEHLPPTIGHIQRAIELLEPLQEKYNNFYGIDLISFTHQLRELEINPNQLTKFTIELDL